MYNVIGDTRGGVTNLVSSNGNMEELGTMWALGSTCRYTDLQGKLHVYHITGEPLQWVELENNFDYLLMLEPTDIKEGE